MPKLAARFCGAQENEAEKPVKKKKLKRRKKEGGPEPNTRAKWCEEGKGHEGRPNDGNGCIRTRDRKG